MHLRLLLTGLPIALLAACNTPPQTPLPRMVLPPKLVADAASAPVQAGAGAQTEAMPAPPRFDPAPRATPKLPPAPPGPASAREPLHLNFEQVPLTTLVQIVYADVLGRVVQIDPKVMERRDLVTFRTPPATDPAQVENAMQLLLKSYGVAALDIGGMVRVLPDTAQTGFLPEIRRGAALPETPERLRPVFQLVELEAVRNVEVANWLKTLFGNRVNVAEDASRNAIVLSGSTDQVKAALEAIRMLDQPIMRGRSSLRVTPTYWSAPELAQTLTQVLAAEGYSMPGAGQPAVQSGGIRYPIVLLPVPATNSILVFSSSDEVLAHVRAWVVKLDQPSGQTGGKNLFTYTARHTSAESLARTVNELVLGGSTAAPPAAAAAGAAVAGATGAAQRSTGAGGRVMVDSNSNTLIFNTSAENYSQLLAMLRTLDQPSKAALIEVTVAEIRLTDDFKLGVEWLFNEAGVDAGSTVAGALGNLASTGAAGLTIRWLNGAGDQRLIVNALAGSNRATILSSPRVMARNGETARIQVGQEVPIITSQQTGVTGTTDGVLQTVQYRSTGVILSVKPSIFSGDRIDLDVSQEVSAAQSTVTGVDISPTISTRKVDTKLTLQHGSTVLLGGLIADGRTFGDSGVPGLKDIPVIGSLFKTDTRNTERTELVVLITPYIISNDSEAVEITEAFKALLPMLGEQLKPVMAPAATAPAAVVAPVDPPKN